MKTQYVQFDPVIHSIISCIQLLSIWQSVYLNFTRSPYDDTTKVVRLQGAAFLEFTNTFHDDECHHTSRTAGALFLSSVIRRIVDINPCTNGNRLTRMIPDTTRVATASATDPSTLSNKKATVATTKTAVLRSVSAITCYGNDRKIPSAYHHHHHAFKLGLMESKLAIYLPTTHCTCSN